MTTASHPISHPRVVLKSVVGTGYDITLRLNLITLSVDVNPQAWRLTGQSNQKNVCLIIINLMICLFVFLYVCLFICGRITNEKEIFEV